uniref:DUF4283 domain-containing protein n=1 Tax=Kalanchoe fedtschenkoi TaxID=63787 RepID=A0A7N0UEP0_KALFE
MAGRNGSTWAQIVAANRQPATECRAGSERWFQMDSLVWERAIKLWEYTLVGRVMGLRPNLVRMQGYSRSRWGEGDFVREWSSYTVTKEVFAEEVTVWIKLPRLDPLFWDAEALSFMRSAIDKLICSDAITASKYRLEYASICVEVSPMMEQLHQVEIMGPEGQSFHQPITYEWYPARCVECETFDHPEKDCPRRISVEKDAATAKKNMEA